MKPETIRKNLNEESEGGLPIRVLLASLKDLEHHAEKRAEEYATSAFDLVSRGAKSWKASRVTYYRDSIRVRVEEDINYDAREVREITLSLDQLELKESDWLTLLGLIAETRLRATSEKEKSKRESRLRDAKNEVEKAEKAILLANVNAQATPMENTQNSTEVGGCPAATCSACGLKWPNRAGIWTRDGADYGVTQTADGETWVKVDEDEYIPGLLAGLADFRERWFLKPNASDQTARGCLS